MFLVNLVPLLLLVGVLTQSGVDADEQLGEQANNLRDTVKSLYDKFIEYSINDDTDALIGLHDEKCSILIDGLPPTTGVDEIRSLLKLIPERAVHIEPTYWDVKAMDSNAEYVYLTVHLDYFNEAGEIIIATNGINILRKNPDGYKVYIVIINRHNQQLA
ncbi:uncharacterized protein LOC117296369 [Asterias rubens]|uniref:uncharacterized protein LOC117296369 n=1 Tax=Asterias rubens TaxID=7604 RepID=UPI001454EC9B|nr:uncharacterized protein LOC117296369 [Asterias rubens]